MVIRQATEADFEAIFLLIKEFSIFQKTPEKVTTSATQMLADKDVFNCFVVINDDAEIVGYACYFFAYYSWSGKAINLDDLYIRESYRNLGIGERLLDKIIETGKQNKCVKVRWQVSKWNTNAINFYIKKGAVINDVEINCDLLL